MSNIEDIYKKDILDFGANIRRLRLIEGFKRQADLGVRCEIDRTQINRIEQGVSNVEIITMVRLAAGLNKELADLVNYNNDEIVTRKHDVSDLLDRIETEKKRLGFRLLQIREYRNFTQLDMDVSTGIGRSAISEYELGIKNIEFRTIVKLKTALQVSMMDLFDYDRWPVSGG